MPVLDFESEYRWAAALLGVYTEKLNAFVELAEICSTCILNSDFTRALQTIDHVDAELGVSLWGLKLRLALTQQRDGFEAQKTLAQNVQSVSTIDGIVQYITHYVSFRNESVVTPANFFSEYRRHEAALKVDSGLRKYLWYHITTSIDPIDSSCASILNFDAAASLIDYFEAFVAVTKLVGRKYPQGFGKPFATALVQLARAISDRRLDGLAFAISGDKLFLKAFPPCDLNAQSAFLSGDYAKASILAEELLKERGPSIDTIELLARSNAAAGSITVDTCLSTEIAKALRSVAIKDDSLAESVVLLQKLALNFYPFNWAESLWVICSAEIEAQSGHESWHLKGAALSPPTYLNPLYGYGVPGDIAEAFFESCLNAGADSPVVTYARYAAGLSGNLPKTLSRESELLAGADRCLSDKAYGLALSATSELLDIGCSYFRLKAAKASRPHSPRIRSTDGMLRFCNI